jgi:phosphate-selective porin OprO and OprP
MNGTNLNRTLLFALTIFSLLLLFTSAVFAGEEDTSAETSDSITDHVGYDGGFYLNDATGNFSLKMNARMQAKYTFEAVEGNEDRDLDTQFSIPAARIKFKGHVISKKIGYALQLDFGKGDALLKDFYADFAFVKNVFHLRVGQWVKPFSRQQITSSGKLEFTGRAMTDKAFGAGRDIGLAFHNNYEKSPKFEWAIGIFNGTGEKPVYKGTADDSGNVKVKPSNVPTTFHPMLVARIGANFGKLKGYSEADLKGGSPRLGLGITGLLDFEWDNNDAGEIRSEFDYIFKAYGFSASGGFYVASVQDGDAFSDQTYDKLGVHAQLGYVIGEMVQPVFRYGVINPEGAKNYEQEIFGGISVYFARHNLKWQTEAGSKLYKDGDEDSSDVIVATQLQLGF